MPDAHQVPRAIKTLLIVMILVGSCFSTFSQDSLPEAHAQAAGIGTPGPAKTGGQGSSLKEAIDRAIKNHKGNSVDNHYYKLISLVETGEWGVAKAEKIKKGSLEVIPADLSRILGRKDDQGQWQVVLPDEVDSYLALLEIFPESLLEDTTKGYIQEAYAVSAQALYSDHFLPWTSNSSAYLYQNYAAHGEGQLDFGFPGNIRTTKSGSLFFAYDAHTWNMCTGKSFTWCNSNYPNAWYYNNAVVIKHSDGEYSSYLHLQTDSIPPEIINHCDNGNGGSCTAVTIPAGTVIGNVGSTGFSTGAHLHYGTGDYPYARCNYTDVYDEDGDGNSTETNICTGGITGGHGISVNFYEKPYTAPNCGTGAGQSPTLCMLYYPNNINLVSQNPGNVAYSFMDVTPVHWAWDSIERLYAAGITGGCATGPLMYCPTSTVTRDQMAVFLLRGVHTSSYVPPEAVGVFEDAPVNYWAADWIEQLASEGITSGCSASPKQYCPMTPVTRDQMAIFLLRAKYGSDYVPAKAAGVFQDVPTDYWAADWIEQLAVEGITSGCSVTPMLYCPTSPVTRDQMAVFLVRTFGLPTP